MKMALALPVRSVKAFANAFLKRIHVYERVKASCLYDACWSIANSRIVEERDSEIEYYRNILVGFHKGDLIFDIGANQGFKTDIFLKLGAAVIAVDPDETNQRILREKFLTYRFRKKAVTVVSDAISDKR